MIFIIDLSLILLIMDNSDSDNSLLLEWEGRLLGTISNPKCSIFINNAYYVINNTTIWEKQRILDIARAKEIVEYQENIYKIHGTYHFLVPFYVVKFRENFLTFDGQHRLASINLMDEKVQKTIEIIVLYFECEKEEEIIQYFQNINSAKPMPLPDFFQSDSREIINYVSKKLEKNFKKFLSYAINKPRLPNIRIDDLKNELYEKSVITKLGIKQAEDLYQKIIKYNEHLSTKSSTDFSSLKGKSSKIYKKCEKYGLYLGLYSNYEWIDIMIDLNNFNNSPKEIEPVEICKIIKEDENKSLGEKLNKEPVKKINPSNSMIENNNSDIKHIIITKTE